LNIRLSILLFLSFCFPLYSFDFFKNQEIDSNNISYIHYSIKTDTILTEYKSNIKKNPASLLKLISSGLLLELKNKKIKSTKFFLEGLPVNNSEFYGNIIVQTNGDPLLGEDNQEYSSSISTFCSKLKKKGIKKIKGSIIIDCSGFPKPYFYSPYNEHFMFYQAPASSAAFSLNSLTVRIIRDSASVKYRFGPYQICAVTPNITISRRIKEPRLIWNFTKNMDTLYLKGSIPSNHYFIELPIGIPYPEQYLGRVIQYYLKSFHIEPPEKISTSYEPYHYLSDIPFHEINPLKIDYILKKGNLESSNFIFEQLFYIMGITKEEYYNYLHHYKIMDENTVIDDFCGLSNKTKLSVKQISNYIKKIKTNKTLWKNWLDVLPKESNLHLFSDSFFDPFIIKTGIIPNACGLFLYDTKNEEVYLFLIHPVDEDMAYPVFFSIGEAVKKSILNRRLTVY